MHTRHSLASIVLIAALCALPAHAAGDVATEPLLPVLRTLDLGAELAWYYRTDVGMLLVSAGDRLHRVDLLVPDGPALEPIELPKVSERGSVVPISRTGLLLVPSAPAGLAPHGEGQGVGRARSSYAIDTLSGRLLWEADPIPAVNLAFSLPDRGIAVIRSLEGEGSVLAVDLLTGGRRWTHELWASMIWIDEPFVRFVSSRELLTVDLGSGEIVRRDPLEYSGSAYAISQEGVLLDRDGREITASSLPPPPPAEQTPAKPLWTFKAAGYMVKKCVDAGDCSVDRVGDDRLLVRSAGHMELLEIRSGKVLWMVKHGPFTAHPQLSPSGGYIAMPMKHELRILDGETGELRWEVEYPKGDEGLKLSKFVSWLADDVAAVVFPDTHGYPRRMSAFSCSQGKLLWTLVLPDGADYFLTAEQRARLIGRIALALVATAVSASNPMSIGGAEYAVVLVPNLDVSTPPQAGPSTGLDAGTAGGEQPFQAAQLRFEACRERSAEQGLGRTHYVIGPKGRYEILEIDRDTGALRTIGRYEAAKVHGITVFQAFDVALSLENDGRIVRLLDLRGAGRAASP